MYGSTLYVGMVPVVTFSCIIILISLCIYTYYIDGTDFIEKTDRVRFFPGDRYSTEMDIVIVDDDVAEPKETFYLHFEVPEGLEPKVELLTNEVPVVIVDDECALWQHDIYII